MVKRTGKELVIKKGKWRWFFKKIIFKIQKFSLQTPLKPKVYSTTPSHWLGAVIIAAQISTAQIERCTVYLAQPRDANHPANNVANQNEIVSKKEKAFPHAVKHNHNVQTSPVFPSSQPANGSRSHQIKKWNYKKKNDRQKIGENKI